MRHDIEQALARLSRSVNAEADVTKVAAYVIQIEHNLERRERDLVGAREIAKHYREIIETMERQLSAHEGHDPYLSAING